MFISIHFPNSLNPFSATPRAFSTAFDHALDLFSPALPRLAMDAGHGEVESLLAALGIVRSVDVQGRMSYAVNVVKSHNNVPATRAIFEEETKCWRCVGEVDAKSIHSSIARAPDATPTSTSPPSKPIVHRYRVPLSPDWTKELVDSSHVRFLKSVDWAASPIGPMRDWSLTLQQSVHMMLADTRPTALQWVRHAAR